MNKYDMVTALDTIQTKLDHVLDELDGCEGPRIKMAESLIFKLSMEINGLIDRLTDEAQGPVDDVPVSGAV